MLLIYGMVIDLVQKQSDVEGVLVQPVLITAVWCGSGEHLMHGAYNASGAGLCSWKNVY